LRRSGATTIVNIWGKSVEDYAYVAERLEAERDGIAALEINVSCPNVKEGGISFGTDPKMMAVVVGAVRKATKLPLITKLSPNVSKISDFAVAARDAGSDMISLINTIPAMAIDIETMRPKLANVTGGLSGPAIKPVAVRMVYEASRAVETPSSAGRHHVRGGTPSEFLIAGASAVAVGTATFVDPRRRSRSSPHRRLSRAKASRGRRRSWAHSSSNRRFLTNAGARSLMETER
jgi:dihydroorotate dehydrogenase (NAD+) catalytic subunit